MRGSSVTVKRGAGFPAWVWRQEVPDEAKALLYRPLELAYVNGTPLALRDITLVMQPLGNDDATGVNDSATGINRGAAGMAGAAVVSDTSVGGTSEALVGGRLRVLGLFSLPEGGQPLNLRRERYELVQLVQGIAAGGRSADVRVLQGRRDARPGVVRGPSRVARSRQRKGQAGYRIGVLVGGADHRPAAPSARAATARAGPGRPCRRQAGRTWVPTGRARVSRRRTRPPTGRTRI